MTAPLDKADYNPLVTFAFEALAGTNTSVGLTASVFNPDTSPAAKCAVVQCETAQVRYRMDGTDPTASVGVLLEVGDELVIWGSTDINEIEFIRTGGVSAQLNVHYSR